MDPRFIPLFMACASRLGHKVRKKLGLWLMVRRTVHLVNKRYEVQNILVEAHKIMRNMSVYWTCDGIDFQVGLENQIFPLKLVLEKKLGFLYEPWFLFLRFLTAFLQFGGHRRPSNTLWYFIYFGSWLLYLYRYSKCLCFLFIQELTGTFQKWPNLTWE